MSMHYGRARDLETPPGYVHDELTAAEVAEREASLVPLTDSVRGLVDAVVRTQVEAKELESVRDLVDELTQRLLADALPGPHGVRFGSDGGYRNYGNPVVGRGNAFAPPLDVQREDGGVWAEFELGPAYEGPPGLVHGGVSAMVLDQLLGEAASAGGKPGMTGTLTVRYRQGTPLGPLRGEAKLHSEEGVKSIIRGRLLTRPSDGSDPQVCVEAEGIFILPRWARQQVDQGNREHVGDA
ncbi:acyl-coenzyme A thioesterase PaaI-like protein [Nocardioides luteus]|uniref:Thioesterase n=1 Tax=Nocardioides luteus TaxID=1844 RepID=A0ABQ5SZY2_9ACTN|nr:PaaI family thioesterase [Nocardioides luteus]MDR7310670.1 acyl-coenzyme A thioesterase PaaI-like protein [Nocardioides luteus]GGR41380.1 thioesterase [Nocardioides luteus]GLJ69549.1 thioesterase [Nocardioides luteus]